MVSFHRLMSTSRFPSKDAPLKEDVGNLGHLLGEVLREQGGTELFARVESVRLLARDRRRDDPKAAHELARLVSGLSPDAAAETVRAFSGYFRLVNLAERVHRIRRRRDYTHRRGTPQPGSLSAVLADLARRQVAASDVRDVVAGLSLVPVFTAHPTEATRTTMLQNEARIARTLLMNLGVAGPLPFDRRPFKARVREDVTLAWQTDEHPATPPTVGDEVEHVAFYLGRVLYPVVPAFYGHLEAAVRAAYGEAAVPGLDRPLLRFASWAGGDMDGNPNVGARTLLAALERQRAVLLTLYRAEARVLYRRLSQSSRHVSVSAALRHRLDDYARRFPEAAAKLPSRHAEMPYRVLFGYVLARLDDLEHGGPAAYRDASELVADLRSAASSLRTHGGVHAGLRRVLRFWQRVVTFGLHLASIDVRQDARVLRRAVAALLSEPGLEDRPAAERLDVLARAVASPPPRPTNDPELAGVLDVFRAIRGAQETFGPASVGLYVISMAEDADDVLSVLLLARAAGLVAEDGSVPLDIAPLFETVPSLRRGADVLARMLEQPTYRRHLAARRDEQVVMLGYSDSNKESGFAASRAAIDGAARGLVGVAEARQVRLTFFHGRGGTASRGGSKPREAVLSEPPGAVRGRHRVTEQGEIIHTKYGLHEIALRTLELMAGAVLEVSAPDRDRSDVDAEWHAALTVIADTSEAAYTALVRDDPGFEEYFRAVTPIDVIERMPLGSRPASRGSGKGLHALRAIPWTFAWTQNRHILPAWYGLGTGLAAAEARFGRNLLRRMAQRWPTFQVMLADAEMVIAKADLAIGSLYADLAGLAGAPFFDLERDEYHRTRELVCEIQQVTEVLEREPTLKRAIELRNPYVDPMSLVQVDMLARWRAGGREDASIERALRETVRGIARGMQNTA
jgi:phosphoenolpyruvate carboxylase